MMIDETALIQHPDMSVADAAQRATEFIRATRLVEYQEKLRPDTLKRQKRDLELFATFLRSIGTNPGDFFTNLDAWRDINADLIETFIWWQKREGYAIGSINVHLATVKAYCKLAFSTEKITADEYRRIQGVKSIPRSEGRTIDTKRERTRKGHPYTKKAAPVEIPDDLLHRLKFPATGSLSTRDSLLMCLLLDHGLRVGEIAILKKRQINLKTHLLTFDRPKVDKDEQKHRLTKDTYAAARAYLPTIPAEQESLFDLAIVSIQERVRTLGERLGLPGLSPHDCRHSFTTRAARAGTPLDRIMQAGGWNSYQMPLHYIEKAKIANEGVILE
jgi:integrase